MSVFDDPTAKRLDIQGRQQTLLIDILRRALQRITATEDELAELRARVNDHELAIAERNDTVFVAILDRLQQAKGLMTGEIERAAIGGRDEGNSVEKPPSGLDEVIRYFGDPKPANGEADEKWKAANMVGVYDLPGVQKLYVHRRIVAPLRAALAKAAATGFYVTTIGCFNPRVKSAAPGAEPQLSLHAFGAALDIDAKFNPQILRCKKDDPRRALWRASPNRIPDEVIAIFKAEGWIWGGDFRNSFDPMHFQWATNY